MITQTKEEAWIELLEKEPYRGKPAPNCRYCANCRTESDGEYGYSSYSYEYCEKYPGYMNLKSFPFKKSMSCFKPDFWLSIYSSHLTGDEDNWNLKHAEFAAHVKRIEEGFTA